MRALVYVDAFMPDEGETVFEILGDSGSALAVPDPTTVLDLVGYPGAPEGDVDAFLKPDTVHDVLRPGPARGRPLADRGEPAPDHPERQHHPVRRPGLEDAPELGGDRHRGQGHPARTQRSMAERAGATITEVAASHVSMVSHPDVTIEAILAAAAAVGA